MTGGFGGSMGGAGQGGKGKRPINVKFEIPYFTTSGIQVRYLKITEPKVRLPFFTSTSILIYRPFYVFACIHYCVTICHPPFGFVQHSVPRGDCQAPWPRLTCCTSRRPPIPCVPSVTFTSSDELRLFVIKRVAFSLPANTDLKSPVSYNTRRYRGFVTSLNPETLQFACRMPNSFEWHFDSATLNKKKWASWTFRTACQLSTKDSAMITLKARYKAVYEWWMQTIQGLPSLNLFD